MRKELVKAFLFFITFISGMLGLNGYTGFLPIFLSSVALFIGMEFRLPETLWFFYLFHIWPPRNENGRRTAKLRLKKEVGNLIEVVKALDGLDYCSMFRLELLKRVQRREKIMKKFGFFSEDEDQKI